MQPSDKEGAYLNNSVSNKVSGSNILINNEVSVLLSTNESKLTNEPPLYAENLVANEVTTNKSENQASQELIIGEKDNLVSPLSEDKYFNEISNNNDKKSLPLPKNTEHKINYELLTNREIKVTQVLFTLKWRLMTQILLALPVIGLFICLLTSLIFHADHINNTICEVYNFLPSISAVTGVSPQRYLWRVCVALHISPRLLVACVAKEFYSSLANRVTAIQRPAFQGMVTIAFFLNLTELAMLCGVTYISNKENYPVHEKLFMLFMIASLIYMVCVVRLLKTVEDTLSPLLLRSLSHKKWLLATKISATIGLLFFFWRHRVHCQPKAFSWFSLCEYVIATCNMLYHVSVALDFSEEHLIVGHIVDDQNNFVDHIATPTAPSSTVTAPVFYTSSLSTSSSAITQNNFNEYLISRDLTSDGEMIKEVKADSIANCCNDNDVTSSDVASSDVAGSECSKDYEGTIEERHFSKGFVAIKNTPPKGLDLVASSSYYSKFSGSSNSSTSSESPCFTDSSSSENTSNSSGNTSVSSGSSGSYSPEYVSSTSSGFASFYDSGLVKQVLSTIHENSESCGGFSSHLQSIDPPSTGFYETGTVVHPQFPSSGIQRIDEDPEEESEVVQTYSPSSSTQNLLDQPEFIIKERVVKTLQDSESISDDLDLKGHSGTDPKANISKEGIFLQSNNSQNFPYVDKTHLE